MTAVSALQGIRVPLCIVTQDAWKTTNLWNRKGNASLKGRLWQALYRGIVEQSQQDVNSPKLFLRFTLETSVKMLLISMKAINACLLKSAIPCIYLTK